MMHATRYRRPTPTRCQRGRGRHAGRRHLLVLLVLAFLVLLLGSPVAAAAPAVRLVPALPDAPATMQARGEFYRHTLAVQVTANPLRLASSPDGQGALCTDDRATLTLVTADTATPLWSHTFAGADRQSIVCIPPQAVQVPTTPGIYELQMVLEDLFPPVYGTRPYYLVGAVALVSTPTPTTTGVPTATPRPQPTDDTAQGALPTGGPTAGPTPAPQPTVTAHPVAPPPDEPVGSRPLPGTDLTWSPTIGLGLGGIVLLGGLGLVLLVRRRAPRPASPTLLGMLTLFDQETYETQTLLLTGETPVVTIRRHPLALVTTPTRDPVAGTIAQIRATAQGPVVQERLADAWTAAVALSHDVTCTLAAGRVTLRYRDPLGGNREIPA
jgi:hypothetical protein